MQVKTKPFTIPRVLFARLSAEVYVRRFWFLLVPWPLLAIGMIAMNRDPRVFAMAIVVGLWPTTIPLRAYFFTSKASRLFQSPVWVSIEDGCIYFHGKSGQGMKVSTDRVSAVVELHGYLALVIGYMRLAFVPMEAFESKNDVMAFTAAVDRAKQGAL